MHVSLSHFVCILISIPGHLFALLLAMLFIMSLYSHIRIVFLELARGLEVLSHLLSGILIEIAEPKIFELSIAIAALIQGIAQVIQDYLRAAKGTLRARSEWPLVLLLPILLALKLKSKLLG